MIIIFEGCDAAGKGTQIELLQKQFECKVFKYPTNKFSMLNDYLERRVELDKKSLFLLFLADIANEQEELRIAVQDYDYVFIDRYVFSTIAYEIDKINYEQAKDIINDIEFVKPDKVILLDIDAKTAQKRKIKQKKLDRYEENAKYLETVRNNFLKLCEERFLTSNWYKIDAAKNIDEIHKDILNVLKK